MKNNEDKWWLNNKNSPFDMETHWKNSKSDKKRDSENLPISQKVNPFKPPKNNAYQMMTVCNNSKKRTKSVTPKRQIKEKSKPKKISNKKSFLFSKSQKPARKEEEESESESKTEKESESETESEIENVVENESKKYVKVNPKKKTNRQINENSRKKAPKKSVKKQSKPQKIEPKRKIKIEFLESSYSGDQIIEEEDEIPNQKITINDEEICSFYRLSDYRIPNDFIFNKSTKPLNLKIIENPENPKFDEELLDAEIRLLPRQYDDFFGILSNHFRSRPKDFKLLMKCLISIDSVLYYDQAFDSIIKSDIVYFLPFSTPKLIILSYKIIKLLIMFRPNYFQGNFLSSMKHFLYIFPTEMNLSLFILYAHSFEFIEDPWPILDLLIKSKDLIFIENNEKENNTKRKVLKYFNEDPGVEAEFSIEDTYYSYLSLLLFLNSSFQTYKENRLKYCRPIFVQSMFDPAISKKASLLAHKAVLTFYDSKFEELISISELFNELKDQEFENVGLKVLFKMNVDSIPIKSKYIFQLINSAHTNETAFLILQKMMNNSQRNEKVSSILLQNSKWLKYGLPTFSHTLMILQNCYKFENNYLIDDIKNCEEIPYFFKAILYSENVEDIKKISSIINDINFDDFKSLSENDFFSLLNEMISDDQNNILLPCLRLLSELVDIQYSRDYKDFIAVLKKLLKNENNKIFHLSLKILASLSQYKKCATIIKDQNVVSVAKKYCQSKSEISLLKTIINSIK